MRKSKKEKIIRDLYFIIGLVNSAIVKIESTRNKEKETLKYLNELISDIIGGK